MNGYLRTSSLLFLQAESTSANIVFLTHLSDLARKLIDSAKVEIQLWQFLLEIIHDFCDLFVETSYSGKIPTMLLDCLEIKMIASGCGVMAMFLREVGIQQYIVVLALNIFKVSLRNYKRVAYFFWIILRIFLLLLKFLRIFLLLLKRVGFFLLNH